MPKPLTTALKLREMILSGQLAPGERVRETHLAEQLGISRQPVRQAIPALAEEGLLVPVGQRGYAVRAFSAAESAQALRLRAVLEGFAAREGAEKGLSHNLLEQLHDCLKIGDKLFSKPVLEPEDELQYGEMNARFHELLLDGAVNPLLETLTQRCNSVPFTSPSVMAFHGVSRDKVFQLLYDAHRQHHAIVDALEKRQPDRAEFLLREHALMQEQSMQLRPGAANTALAGGSAS